MSEIVDIIKTRRTIRKFTSKKVPLSILKKCVTTAIYAPSAGNLQFVEYLIVNLPQQVEKIFFYTKWAGYIYPKGTPQKEERPQIFIVVLINKNKSSKPDLRDVGAGVQNILLSLWAHKIGSCWIGNCDKERIHKLLHLPSYIEIDSVIAVGYPLQLPKVVPFKGSIKYYLDKENRLCVPKRPFKDVIFINEYRERV